jgi:hypothetical protein
MQPGVTYCVRAQTRVKAIRRYSAFSQVECVEVQGKDICLSWDPCPGDSLLGACFKVCWVPLVLSLPLASLTW